VVLFFSIFFLFLELGSRAFHLSKQDIFWFLFTLLTVISIVGIIFIKSLISYYLDKFSSIDRISKETLHELSTPIATIKANCDILTKNSQNEKELIRIDRISKASQRLMELYYELEWMIKNDSGEQPKTKVMLDELIEDLIEDFMQKANDKNIKIDSYCNSFLLEIDHFGLKKTISNIIDNAIKYADTNSTISISLESKILTVTNHGIEINPDDLLTIFDKYYRGEHSQKGYGIGLYAVKTFCDKNGIPISINSQNKITVVELKFTRF